MFWKVINEIIAILPIFLCGFTLGLFLRIRVEKIKNEHNKERENYFKRVMDECSRLEKQMEDLANEVQSKIDKTPDYGNPINNIQYNYHQRKARDDRDKEN